MDTMQEDLFAEVQSYFAFAWAARAQAAKHAGQPDSEWLEGFARGRAQGYEMSAKFLRGTLAAYNLMPVILEVNHG
jgi:hypothetical protein